MLAEAFANDVEAGRQGGIAKRPLALPREWRLDGCGQRLFRVLDLRLGLGKGCSDLADGRACVLHNVSTWVGVLRTVQELRLHRQNKAGGDELVLEMICQAG